MIRRPGLVLLVLLVVAPAAGATAEAMRDWRQGRPQDGLAEAAAALTSRSPWQAWYDAGRLAAAAGEPGIASTAWLAAYRRAPAQPRVLAALRSTTPLLPRTWCERLGPLGRGSSQVAGLLVAAIAGIVLGWSVVGRTRGSVRLVAATVVVLALVPAAAALADAARPWTAVRLPTTLRQDDGKALTLLPAGLVVTQEATPVEGWVRIRTADGRTGMVSAGDLEDGRGPLPTVNEPGTTGWSPSPPAR